MAMKATGQSNETGAERNIWSRRGFFSRVGDGFYGAALAYLLGNDLFAANPFLSQRPQRTFDLQERPPRFPPRAKSVIHLFMNGGPSQVDLFDPKPALQKFAGQPPSRDLASEIRAVREAGGLMPSPFRFSKHGESGIELSELLPHLATRVDDIAIIRSMFTTHIAHEASLFIMQSGRMFPGRPSLGAWVVYGLGSENQNLPAYVVLDDPLGLPINGISELAGRFSTRSLSGYTGAFRRLSIAQSSPQGTVAQPGGEAFSLPPPEAGPKSSQEVPGRERIGGSDRRLRVGRPHATGGIRRFRPLSRKRRHAERYGLNRSKRPLTAGAV